MRRRYLALKTRSENVFTQRDLFNEIRRAFLRLFGESGLSQSALSLIEYDEKRRLAILRCSHKTIDMVRASLAIITEINEGRCVINVIAVSGTLKALKRKVKLLSDYSLRDLSKKLRMWLGDSERVVLVGIGNDLRRDDSVGIFVAQSLMKKASENIMIIDSETVPESYLDNIVTFNPTHILIIDAAMLGLHPGEVRIIEIGEFLKAAPAVSTHALPLQVFCIYLERVIGAKVALILIQPEETGFGEGLSFQVTNTAEKLQDLLFDLL